MRWNCRGNTPLLRHCRYRKTLPAAIKPACSRPSSHRCRSLAPAVSGNLPAAAPKFFGRHPPARRRSSIYRGHRGKESGGGRAFVAAHIALFKFFAANDFYRLAIGAPNAGAPFTRFLLKCPYDKSLVLHTLQHRNSRWSPNGRTTWRPEITASLPHLRGTNERLRNGGDDPPKWGIARWNRTDMQPLNEMQRAQR